MTVLFLSLIFVFTFSVVVGLFLSCPPPLRFQNSVQFYECSQTLSFQYISLVSCTNCSMFKFMLLYSLLIFFWYSVLQSVAAFFVMTRNQYQCDNKQNCINCLAPKLSHSQYEVCSCKCWKPPTDFPNNMQINGCHLNSNILHRTPGF